uniref:Uncharacterized protein n=1 Tax=Aegilops tauschii subsp. strangulata TaxID=200361 RepID=A0A453G4P2_AEGTS
GKQENTYIQFKKGTYKYQSILILLLIKYKPPTIKHGSRR